MQHHWYANPCSSVCEPVRRSILPNRAYRRGGHHLPTTRYGWGRVGKAFTGSAFRSSGRPVVGPWSFVPYNGRKKWFRT